MPVIPALGNRGRRIFFFFIFILLFICAYKAWFISPPCPHLLPYHPQRQEDLESEASQSYPMRP
jgi:hypothetical protein